jgi:rod shape-determining protein MreD
MYNYISLADIMPNLILILVVSNAYMQGQMTGLLLGLFSGLLVDLMSGSYIIGIYALIYMLIGYCIGHTNKYYSNDDYTFPIIIIAISDLGFGFLFYIFEFLLRGRLNFLFYLKRLILPEIIYTVVVSIFLYKLLHMIHNRLEHRREAKEV